MIAIIKKGYANLLPKGISPPTTSQREAPTATVKEKEVSTVVAKTCTPENAGILDPLNSCASAT